MKHTKGEWEYKKYPHCTAIETTLENGQSHTLFTDQFCYASKFDGSSEANAKLIAAAPELLEALKNARNVLVMASMIDKTNSCNAAAEKCKEAINKATL